MDNCFNKNNVYVIEGKRYYKLIFSGRRRDIENTRPLFIKIDGKIFEEHTWGSLLTLVTNYALQKSEYDLDTIKGFKTDWTNSTIFLDLKVNRTAFALKNGLFINTNHTALHSYWLLQDILIWCGFDLEKIEIVIRRYHCTEPKDVKEMVIKRNKVQFESYLKTFLLIEKEVLISSYLKILTDLDSKFTNKIAKTDESLFLIDNKADFYNYKNALITFLKTKTLIKESLLNHCEMALKYYYEFIKTL